MARLFISYRREDSAAGRLADHLRQKLGEKEIFFDVKNIKAGDDFAKVIESGIASSEVLLAVIGKSWLGETAGHRRLDDEKDFVRLEIAAALKRKIRVVPVLVEGASMPAEEDLPPELKGLRRHNWMEIRDVSFDRDVAALIEDLTGKPFSTGQSLLKKPVIWLGACAALAVVGVLVWLQRPQGPALPINSPDFKLQLQVRLNEAFGPVDKAPELKLAHRLPRDMGTNLLEVGKPIEDRRFEYESPVFMPPKGERYRGLLHRIVREAVQGEPRWLEVCFERKVDTLTRDPIIRLRCDEGGTCQVAPDDFGWAQPCRSQVGSSSLISVAHAGAGKAPAESGWVVPSLQTLRGLQGGTATIAYTEFMLTSGPLLGLKGADRVTYAIRVNGVPIYIDGLPPEVYAVPFNAETGLKLEFGLENLDFSGKNAGYEDIELTLQFMQGDRLIRQAVVRLQYVALRSKPETQVTADQDLAIRWKGDYHPGKRDDVYQIFLLATPSVKEAENRKKRIDEARLSVDSLPILAVVRPPLGENQNFGVALGIRQPSGQVKFTFDDETSRRLCRGVIRLAAESRLMDNSAFRRSVDDRRDSKQCRQF